MVIAPQRLDEIYNQYVQFDGFINSLSDLDRYIYTPTLISRPPAILRLLFEHKFYLDVLCDAVKHRHDGKKLPINMGSRSSLVSGRQVPCTLFI